MLKSMKETGYMELLCNECICLPNQQKAIDVSHLGANGVCIVPSGNDKNYVLNRFVPGFSENFNAIFPSCIREVKYDHVIYVPQQYSNLQDAINYVAENGPNNATIVVDKNYVYDGDTAISITAASSNNKLNGLSLISCGATIYCKSISFGYAGFYIEGPLTGIKIIGFNILNEQTPAGGSAVYGILAIGACDTKYSLVSILIKNNTININGVKGGAGYKIGISFANITSPALCNYIVAADIEHNTIENFVDYGILVEPVYVETSGAYSPSAFYLKCFSNNIKAQPVPSPYPIGIGAMNTFSYICGNNISSPFGIIIRNSNAYVVGNTLTNTVSSEHSSASGITCIQNTTISNSVSIYKNNIRGYHNGVKFQGTVPSIGNLVFQNIFILNEYDVSDYSGPMPGGGLNISYCNQCSDGKCGSCVALAIVP